MIGVLFLIILFFGINQAIFSFFKKRHSFFSVSKMNLLYLYHTFFYGVYTWYAYNNPSDSKNYYQELTIHSGTWLELFGTDTLFINFLSYPFYSIGFNYDMLMFTFAWLGYLGFVYAYLFFREKIPIKIKVFKKIDFLTLVLFFPNMHFWTASLGKGSAIFLGLMMFTYSIVQPSKRLLLLFLGSAIIFYIRPHVFMFVAVGAVLGFMSGRQKIPLWQKLMIFVVMLGSLVLLQDKILGVMNLQNSDNLIEDFQAASEKNAEDLSKAGSGVDMSTYPLPLKLFTFWFRPLFVDAPNLLGLITSVENLIYLLLFLKIIRKDFIKFIKKSPALVKMSFVIFFTASLAMTFVMSNLGIIMRQKTMVMYFIFFVIYYYMAEKKYKKLIRLRDMKRKREAELVVQTP
ncbi:hypothetical protein C8P64_3059 [Christiangramia gaetbulicola]|uniref:Uncharacterized protein n=1 Tax=Christiangramia gaetbulicola TaxID=703340 RepID=A0A2T6AFR1_9FLAO|nr:hypothetical protein [Christiangramia gaetbulicola]PTX42629.1 hypothetical protein C8P64_3059 [Christiangramia gaetbulicola]